MKTIGARPVGLMGYIAGMLMNLIHAARYKKIINTHIINDHLSGDISVLDIGCGGGKTIKIFSTIFPGARIYGMDHSEDMVNLSRRVNKAGIDSGKIEIIEGDVNSLPFPDNYFDIVSAFDTISFWDTIDNAINEISRVLRPEGFFLIVNGYPREGSKWYDVVRFKTDTEYRLFLMRKGFTDIEITIDKGMIIIKAGR